MIVIQNDNPFERERISREMKYGFMSREWESTKEILNEILPVYRSLDMIFKVKEDRYYFKDNIENLVKL